MEAADALSGKNKCSPRLPRDSAEMAILQNYKVPLSLSALSTQPLT